MPEKHWKLLDSRQHSDHTIFSLHEDYYRVEPPGHERNFVRLHCPAWINIVPVTAGAELVLVRQYRHGIKAVTLEIPGGMVDAGEDPQLAAGRELLEETGYQAQSIRPLGSIWPNPAIQDNLLYLYAAEGVQRVGEPQPDPFEKIEVETVPLDRVPELVASGQIRHALVLAALAVYGLRLGPAAT